MLVVISDRNKEKKPIYHLPECKYAKMIKTENRFVISSEQASKRKLCACQYCSGLRGIMRVYKDILAKWETKYDISITYDKNSDRIYVKTDVGFWRIYLRNDDNQYLLFHRNKYDSSIPYEVAISGNYHRQKDVKATQSLQKIIEYIAAHDKAKMIIADDYHNLPRKTKRQKKYYKIAKKKAARKQAKRMDMLFSKVEQELHGNGKKACG